MAPGEDAEFTITVTNTGTAPLTNVQVEDPSWATALGRSAHSRSARSTRTRIPARTGVTEAYTNTATATGTYGSETVTDSDTAEVVVDYQPEVSITKEASPSSVPETGNVTFTIVVTNDGHEPVTIDALTDTDFGLSAHCPSAVGTSIDSGKSYTCEFTESLSGDASGDDHENTATVTVSDADGDEDEASDSATVTFTDVWPDISVTKTANPRRSRRPVATSPLPLP